MGVPSDMINRTEPKSHETYVGHLVVGFGQGTTNIDPIGDAQK